MGDRVAGFVKTVLGTLRTRGTEEGPTPTSGADSMHCWCAKYRDFPEESHGTGELDDENLLKVTADVIQEIASAGNVVIAGRGSNIILREMPHTLHVGLISSMDMRVERIRGARAAQRGRSGAVRPRRTTVRASPTSSASSTWTPRKRGTTTRC